MVRRIQAARGPNSPRAEIDLGIKDGYDLAPATPNIR
jgi:hypothetical protein